jgi:hypothetical protein
MSEKKAGPAAAMAALAGLWPAGLWPAGLFLAALWVAGLWSAGPVAVAAAAPADPPAYHWCPGDDWRPEWGYNWDWSLCHDDHHRDIDAGDHGHDWWGPPPPGVDPRPWSPPPPGAPPLWYRP